MKHGQRSPRSRIENQSRHDTVCMTAMKVLEVLIKILHASVGTIDRRESGARTRKADVVEEKQCQDPLTAENQSYI